MKLREPASLQALAGGLDAAEIFGDVRHVVTEVVDDSRIATGASLFVAPPHSEPDAWRFISDAQRRGAQALLLDRETYAAIPTPAAYCIVVADVRAAASRLANIAYGMPAEGLPVVGVTGTNGKTSVTFMLEAICREAGYLIGRIGTLGASFDNVTEQLGYTTPPPLVFVPLLARMRERGVNVVAMEVSSHALALQRTGDLRFSVGILTNITRDHLDFHKTVEAYAAAKRQLFERSETGVFNLDDAYGREFFHAFGGIGYTLHDNAALQDAAAMPAGARIIRATAIRMGTAQTEFTVDGRAYFLQMPGLFSVANALAAIGAARAFGIDDAHTVRALGALTGIPGRMERIVAADISVFVDYAHTPDALERVLAAAREGVPTRTTVVFGCGGGRDRGKRPVMGEIAERLADRVIVTSDNPRDEEPEEIVREIQAGMQTQPIIELDRAAAIARAVGEAVPGEAIIIAGKGAETEQIIRGTRTPFDDREHARNAVARRRSA